MAREIVADPDTIPLRVADGTIVEAQAWQGKLELVGRRFTVEVVAIGNRYLLGREILDQLEVCFQFGREVSLRFTDGI
ncbi:MAG TPA: hypothetical protein VK689_17055 [Armatimonadota bacterium]|nr:hypothetical protein [Armatimonadota bacterium]